MSKHTPGAWRNGGLVASLKSGSQAMRDQDAPIVAAAPELLAALRLIDGITDRLEQDGYLGDGDVIAIRAAIAKATK